MKRTKDYTLLALFIPFVIAVLACLPGCYSKANKVSEYSGGRYIDLPEEISIADSTDNLGVRITKDTIHFYFKH